MRPRFVIVTALAASLTWPFSFAARAAVGSDGAAVAEAWNRATPIERAQYYDFDGVDYCWYDDGWQGPGWYWCGYDWDAGYGWGGPYGWNGWGGGYFWWRHRHHGHDHDQGHDDGHGRGVFHEERPRQAEVRPPPHGHAPLEGAYNHEGHFDHQRLGAGSNPIQNANPSGNRANPYSQHNGPDVSSRPTGSHPAGNYIGPGPVGGNGGLSGGGGGGFRSGGGLVGGGFGGGHGGGHR